MSGFPFVPIVWKNVNHMLHQEAQEKFRIIYKTKLLVSISPLHFLQILMVFKLCVIFPEFFLPIGTGNHVDNDKMEI